MYTDTLLSLILPSLQGSVSISLNDQQLRSLIDVLLKDKKDRINSIHAQEGFLELNVKIPIIGGMTLNVQIDSIHISSSKQVVKLRLMNLNRLLVKGVTSLVSTPGVESSMEDQILALDITKKLSPTLARLPTEAKDKLDSLKISTSIKTDNVGIKVIVN